MKKFMDSSKKFLLYGGVSRTEYDQIREEIRESNRKNLIMFSAIATVFLAIMFLVSLLLSGLDEFRWIYASFAVFSGCILLCTLYGIVKQSHILVLMHIFMSAMFVLGIMLGAFSDPDEQTVTFIALLLTVPVLFIDKPVRMTASILVHLTVFVIMACCVKEGSVLLVDITDAVVFGTISAIVSSYMMSVKCQRYLYEQQAITLSEMDMLTRVRNRNSFEMSMKDYPSLCRKTLTSIYIDVNGLHELNNTKGHEAGDIMLRYIASVLQEQFGKKDTYRIGGDEFVVFITDVASEEIQKKMNEVIQSVEKENYHISVGHATQTYSSVDMNTLIKNAEKEMYEEKRRYYRERGIERRER